VRDPDDELAGVTALGVVPVQVDEPRAPRACAALRELHGQPLLHWAITALTASPAVGGVVVAVPPMLEPAVRDVVPTAPVVVEVLPVPAGGVGHGVLAALRSASARGAGAGGQIVVVHDPLYALSTAALVRTAVRELGRTAGAVAVVPARPVTDTLKEVDADGVVLGTVDREGHRLVGSPQAYRRQALLDALAAADDADLCAHSVDVLPRLVTARGGRLGLVPLPGEAFRIGTQDDLVLAHAVLAVDLDLCRRMGVTTVD
jgi:2-C-methyl-D-erythritol 4-phosphate cytidylyltransferase